MNRLFTDAGAEHTYLETKRSKLSSKDSSRWSFRPDPLATGAVPLTLTSALPVPMVCLAPPFVVAALPFWWRPFSCGRRRGKLPSRILSNSSGIGGARLRHMSAIDRRLRMSAWKTCEAYGSARWALAGHKVGRQIDLIEDKLGSTGA